MANIEVDGTNVVVSLSLPEALVACRRRIVVPISSLRMVRVQPDPMHGLCLRRAPGLGWPGRFALGTCRHDGHREFVAVRRNTSAVVLEVNDANWGRVVVSHPDAVNLAAELAGYLLGRGPGAPNRRGAFPAPLD